MKFPTPTGHHQPGMSWTHKLSEGQFKNMLNNNCSLKLDLQYSFISNIFIALL